MAQLEVLTWRKGMFCLEYIKNDGNGAQAAMVTGITRPAAGSWASKVLKERVVQDELLRLHREVEKGTDIFLQSQIVKLERLYALSIQKGKLQLALSAVKEQNILKNYHGKTGKRLRKKRIETPATVEDKVAEMSDDELERIDSETG